MANMKVSKKTVFDSEEESDDEYQPIKQLPLKQPTLQRQKATHRVFNNNNGFVGFG